MCACLAMSIVAAGFPGAGKWGPLGGYNLTRLGVWADEPGQSGCVGRGVSLGRLFFGATFMPLFGRQPVRLPLMHWNQVVPRPEAGGMPRDAGYRLPALRGVAAGPDPGDQYAVHGRCHKHLLLEDIVVRGDLRCSGTLLPAGRYWIEPSARFSGTLQGAEVVRRRRVMGTVIGTQRVEVTATGKVAGIIATRNFQARNGSGEAIDGQINILNADNTISTHATTADHHVAVAGVGDRGWVIRRADSAFGVRAS